MEASGGHFLIMESRNEEIRPIIKGKRTKRQRIQSSSSQSEEAFLEDHNNGGSNVFSSSSSLDQIQTSTDEEDEQDMAHCLILLAQAVRSPENTPMSSKSPNTHMYSPTPAPSPISFLRPTGKMRRPCDYECKTCGRTFHSFQALGGHRASHKKPKASSAIEGAKKEFQLSFFGGGEEEEEEEEIKSRFSHPLSLSLNPRSRSGNNKSSKFHECSICGAEFSSGQALGGHMRRHRAPLMVASSSLSLNPPMEDLKPGETQIKRKRFRVSLDLDLNLPAESEDDKDRRESKLMRLIHSKQQHESPHVFSPPAVVNCLH